jgi:hypothetical protein
LGWFYGGLGAIAGLEHPTDFPSANYLNGCAVVNRSGGQVASQFKWYPNWRRRANDLKFRHVN